MKLIWMYYTAAFVEICISNNPYLSFTFTSLISILKFLLYVRTPDKNANAFAEETLASAKLGIEDLRVAYLMSFLQHPIKGKLAETNVPTQKSLRAVTK